jgi:hypothetical protein
LGRGLVGVLSVWVSGEGQLVCQDAHQPTVPSNEELNSEVPETECTNSV